MVGSSSLQYLFYEEEERGWLEKTRFRVMSTLRIEISLIHTVYTLSGALSFCAVFIKRHPRRAVVGGVRSHLLRSRRGMLDKTRCRVSALFDGGSV